MATAPATVELILDRAGDSVTARKMFGEYALYHGGKLVALVCDDELFVKATDAGRAMFTDLVEAPPYPGAKPCLAVAGDLWDDGEWLMGLFRTTAAHLPEPKPRKPRGTAQASRPAT